MELTPDQAANAVERNDCPKCGAPAGSACRSRGNSPVEDAVAKEGEACSSVYLARDPLGLGVHAFGGAVVEGHGQGRADGIAVLNQPADESMQVSQVSIADGGDPLFKTVGVALAWGEQASEGADESDQFPHLQASGGQLLQRGFGEVVPDVPLGVDQDGGVPVTLVRSEVVNSQWTVLGLTDSACPRRCPGL